MRNSFDYESAPELPEIEPTYNPFDKYVHESSRFDSGSIYSQSLSGSGGYVFKQPNQKKDNPIEPSLRPVAKDESMLKKALVYSIAALVVTKLFKAIK